MSPGEEDGDDGCDWWRTGDVGQSGWEEIDVVPFGARRDRSSLLGALGQILSFGSDAADDVCVTTSVGVHRLVAERQSSMSIARRDGDSRVKTLKARVPATSMENSHSPLPPPMPPALTRLTLIVPTCN